MMFQQCKKPPTPSVSFHSCFSLGFGKAGWQCVVYGDVEDGNPKRRRATTSCVEGYMEFMGL